MLVLSKLQIKAFINKDCYINGLSLYIKGLMHGVIDCWILGCLGHFETVAGPTNPTCHNLKNITNDCFEIMLITLIYTI